MLGVRCKTNSPVHGTQMFYFHIRSQVSILNQIHSVHTIHTVSLLCILILISVCIVLPTAGFLWVFQQWFGMHFSVFPCMPCSLLILPSIICLKSTNCECPHYEVFYRHFLSSVSGPGITSAPCFQKTTCVSPIMCRTKLHTQTHTP